MRHKKWIKHLLAGLFLCITVPVFAAEKLYFIGDVATSKLYYSDNTVQGSIDHINYEVIKDYIENRPGKINRLLDTKFIGFHDGYNGYQIRKFSSRIKYQTFITYSDGSSKWLPVIAEFIPVSPFGPISCPKGSGLYGANLAYKDSPAGCYVWVDCDKISTMPNATPEQIEACKPDPCTEERNKGLPQSAACKQKCDATSNEKGNRGGLRCENGKVVDSCVWADNLNARTKSSRDYLENCVREHEEQHRNHGGKLTCLSTGRGDFVSDNDAYECDGYIKEYQCLSNQDPEDVCKNEIDNNKNICIDDIIGTKRYIRHTPFKDYHHCLVGQEKTDYDDKECGFLNAEKTIPLGCKSGTYKGKTLGDTFKWPSNQ